MIGHLDQFRIYTDRLESNLLLVINVHPYVENQKYCWSKQKLRKKIVIGDNFFPASYFS